jgi:esterase/lipase superfamily enzyme
MIERWPFLDAGGVMSRALPSAIDPEQTPYREELAANDIAVIDLTKIQAGDELHHSKFAQSPEIVQPIGTRLSISQTLRGLGDNMVSATEGAATRSAPQRG